MAYANIAQTSDISRLIFKNQIRERRDKCVFISHKKEDEQAAMTQASFLWK